MSPCLFLFIAVVMIVGSNHRYWNIDMLCSIGDWFIVDVSIDMLNWLVINVSHGVLDWFELSVSCEVGMASLWMVVVGTFVMVVSDMSIKRCHNCLMVLVSMLMLISMIVEFDMWGNGFTSMNEFFMMVVLNWVRDLMMDNLVMVVWSFVVNIVVNFVDVVRLMVEIMMVIMIVMVMMYNLVVYGLNMMDVNIMMIEIVMIEIVMIIEAVIRVDIMVNMSMTSISEVVKLVREMFPLFLMTEPFHIFMVGVMMVIMIVMIMMMIIKDMAIRYAFHIIVQVAMWVVTVHRVTMNWIMHLMNWSRVMGWMSEFVSIIWILSE